eukprot:767806-Hanusia_phi.AAC.4
MNVVPSSLNHLTNPIQNTFETDQTKFSWESTTRTTTRTNYKNSYKNSFKNKSLSLSLSLASCCHRASLIASHVTHVARSEACSCAFLNRKVFGDEG